MSIHKKSDGVFEVRWREGGRNKSLRVHGAYELAKKIERKKMSVRDENRHLDMKREVNFRMSALIDRYWTHYGSKKKRSATGRKAFWRAFGPNLGRSFVREVDGESRADVGTRTSPTIRVCRREQRCGTSTSCTT